MYGLLLWSSLEGDISGARKSLRVYFQCDSLFPILLFLLLLLLLLLLTTDGPLVSSEN
ncbi:hypothetical protein COCCADRAFT_85095 [Bipolaris zeicola 26-R-13]|uniref:Uncharacterized protein n=1 Tax=Cochliobolus carbonum (strain 26-R-13) TaxID=930089 RepID=W6YIV6_COCC2|nr:uncharacterized protein COCCADRAFT_85095 [Bipolaris zeicola 26-R-13]EUC37628.1 hypothetical protein COCCADRAFT_85095 [Bipolaris zeicola 26-R-13]